jgi:hypothetical protein
MAAEASVRALWPNSGRARAIAQWSDERSYQEIGLTAIKSSTTALCFFHSRQETRLFAEVLT